MCGRAHSALCADAAGGNAHQTSQTVRPGFAYATANETRAAKLQAGTKRPPLARAATAGRRNVQDETEALKRQKKALVFNWTWMKVFVGDAAAKGRQLRFAATTPGVAFGGGEESARPASRYPTF